MFLIVGTMIGLNLMIRVALGETRERRNDGYARAGHRVQLGLGEIAAIAAKSVVFLAVSVALGLVLDLAFGSTLTQIFG